MLSSALYATYKAQYERVIDTLGIAAVFKYSKTNATANIVCGSRIAGDKDDAIVNAYGIGARVFTLKAADFPANPPIKFDTLTIGAETYVIDHVSPVHLNGSVFGYRCFSKGK